MAEPGRQKAGQSAHQIAVTDSHPPLGGATEPVGRGAAPLENGAVVRRPTLGRGAPHSLPASGAPVEPVQWGALLADEEIVERYRTRVFDRGADECAYWCGALSSTGHGKLRVGRRPAGTSRVVSAHVFGFLLEHGADALDGGRLIVRHVCDEPSCQNPGHWRAGQRADNIADYYARRRLAGHPLADVRGARGRAAAIRDAIKAAGPGQAEAVIAAAIRAGFPGQDRQGTLF